MIIVYDTSVLVAVCIQAHPRHAPCCRFFNSGLHGDHQILVCSHALAEMYAVLTRLPVQPRLSPAMSHRLVSENILQRIGTQLAMLVFDQSDYIQALGSCATHGFSGGMVYDHLIHTAALRVKADAIVTLNLKHFRRIAHQNPDFVRSP